MGAVEEVATGAGNALLGHGPIGLLALFGWLAAIMMGMAVIVVWRALRASETARLQDWIDNAAAAEKDRAEQDRKIDRLQSILEARSR